MSSHFSIQYLAKQAELLGIVCDAHSAFLAENVFSGPSLHFHTKTLEARAGGDFEAFSNGMYATLASWGMHRSGTRGSKMREYVEFEAALRHAWKASEPLMQVEPGKLLGFQWKDLQEVFQALTVMRSSSHLVAASKVMAHLLPHLVAPIDREYTLRFLHGKTSVPKDIDAQWSTFRAIHEYFYHPLFSDPRIALADETWRICEPPAATPWHTSRLKLIDNLVIGACVHARNAGGAA